MAFTEFFVDPSSGGSDMAAGTTTGASSVTSTNGNWGSAAANRFTAAAGTPFSGVAVNDWASIYLDATTTGAVYVAQVTAVNAGGASIDLSTTAKYGTAPSNGATGRSCQVGGSWLSELPFASGGLTGTVPASTLINVKVATYTIVASRTFSLAGTTTAPLWFRGYNTTPGDCDSNPALAKPTLAFNATFAGTASGPYQLWSSFDVTGSRSASIWLFSGNPFASALRMRFENTSSNAAAIACTCAPAVGGVYAYCYFKCPTTATTTGTVSITTATNRFVGCVAEGGGRAGYRITSGSAQLINCIAVSNTGSGIEMVGLSVTMIGCTIYAPTSDGIAWTATPPTAGCMVVGCLITNAGRYGIVNGGGTDTSNVFRACNTFFACSSGNESGFGDSPAFFEQNESGSPFVNAPSDLTLAAGAVARQTGFPGVFENETYTSYMSAGAVQPTSASAGGGLLRPVGMTGGLV